MKLANAKIVAALAEDHAKHKELHRLLSLDTRLLPQDLKIRLICDDEGENFGPVIEVPLHGPVSALSFLDSRRCEIEEALKQLGVEL